MQGFVTAIREHDNAEGAIALESRGRRPLSYSALARQIDELTVALRAIGVAKSDRIAAVLPEGGEAAVASIAFSAAATFAPLNPILAVGEFNTLLSSLRTSTLVVQRGVDSPAIQVAESIGMRVIELVPDLDASAGTFSLFERTPLRRSIDALPTDASLLVFTSGTSARPKLVPLTDRNLVAAASSIASVLELSAADRCLAVMPLFHIHGLSTLFATMLTGGTFIATPPFAADRFIDDLTTFRPTWYSASPTIHRVALEQVTRTKFDARRAGLRFIRSASAPMPIDLIRETESAFGVPFIEAYGMTEASPQIASNRLPPRVAVAPQVHSASTHDENADHARLRKPGSVGRAAGPEIAILNATGNPLPIGEEGEIAIRGQNVTKGYLDDPAANDAAYIHGWLRTGDLGKLDADGDLFVTGRLKEIINRGGEKISPRIVEEVLLTHPAITQAAVFAVPHRVLGEAVAAAVVLNAHRDTLGHDAAGAIRKFAAERIASFAVPQQIVIVDAIPHSTTGKLNRRTLAKAFGLEAIESPATKADHVAPRTAAERRVARAFADVLGIEPPSIHVNFLDLGGHSLVATQLLSRLEGVFRITLPIGCLFDHSTVERLTNYIAARLADEAADGERSGGRSASRTDIPRRIGSSPAPLSFAQQRVYFMDGIGAAGAYNMSASLRLDGPLDVNALTKSLDELRRRHESLRTTFHVRGDRPMQIVAAPRAEPLPITDLAGLDDFARDEEICRLSTAAASAPFDLRTGPLFRASLLRLADEAHVLLLSMHHIISDGWSVGVMYRELQSHYAAIRSGDESTLPALAIQYDDFATWQRDQVAAGALDAQIAYWKTQLAGSPPACAFPADHPRPAIQTFRGATRRTTISSDLLARLRRATAAENVTPFMTLLAAMKTLLFRYTGQDDCVVGTPIANRQRPELEPLVGFFANTLVLRTDLSGDPTFRELLGRVKKTSLDAYANQDVPLERIVDELQIARDLGRSPLFQTMFAFQSLSGGGNDSSPHAAFELDAGLIATPFRTENGTAKFDLTLYLTETRDGLAITWQYNADLFEPTTIERLGRHFETLLESVADDAGQRVSALAILPTAERNRIALDWNRTAVPRETGDDYIELFEAQVELTPDALAAIDTNSQLTYRQINARANQIARHLQAIGVGKDAVVAVCRHRSVDLLATLLAVWKTGSAYLSLDPNYPADRLTFMLADAKASLIVTDGDLLPKLPASAVPIVRLDDVNDTIAKLSNQGLPRERDGDGLAYVIYTSGSTGLPKGVRINRSNVCHYAQSMAEATGITAGDRYLHTASFAFSSSVRQFVVPLSRGATVVIANATHTRDPQVLFDYVQGERVSVIDLVPSFFSACVTSLQSIDASAREQLLTNDLRLILCASEPLPASLVRDWRQLAGDHTAMINLFGQTETTGIVTRFPIPADDELTSPIVPIGTPIANTCIYILDDAMNVVPVGVIGELYVGGKTVGGGYIGRDELNARHFVRDPFDADAAARLYRSGDLARYRADGVIEIAGRADGQIKVRGFRIEPGDIEAALLKDDGVRAAVAIAVDDTHNPTERRVVAFVEPTVDAATLRAFLRQHLPDYMVPQTILALDKLPRTPNGKIDRAALIAAAKTNDNSPTPTPARRRVQTLPRTEVEQALAGVWKHVLHLDRVGVDENFFDLGGNSLLSINVIALAAEAGLQVNLSQLYQNQTIADLARVMTEASVLAAVSEAKSESSSSRDATPPHVGETPVIATIDSLRAYGIEALTAAGLSPEGAAVVTEVQLEASLRGQQTHNMVSIPRYAKRIATGKLNAAPNIRVEFETANSARVDGDNGPGQWVSTVAMALAIRKARETGVGMVGVRRSNHFGAAGHYVAQAAAAGFIGICTTNGPLILAPTGGATPTFGNNPIGVGIPAGKHPAIVLDIAMSVVPRGKIGLHVAEGKPLPHGWILDANGKPSTNLADLAAGLGVPIGGHKGYGLAMVMEVLAGVLGGAGFCADHQREKIHGVATAPDYGHFFMVIDPQRFMPAGEFATRVDRLIEQTKGGRVAEGAAEILIPGEMEARAREKSLREGVRLRPSTYRALMSYAKDARLKTAIALMTDNVVVVNSPKATPAAASTEAVAAGSAIRRADLDGDIVSRFRTVVAMSPDHVAVTDGVRTWTYAELDSRSDQLAAAIHSRDTGSGEGCIAYLVDHSPQMILCALAALKAGRTYLCIHPAMPLAARRDVIADAAPFMIVTDAKHAAAARELAGDTIAVVTIESSETLPSTPPSISLTSDSAAAIFYTSGSTGKPKGVVKSHRSILHRAWLAAKDDGASQGDRQSLLTSCGFASSEADVFGTLLNGATLCLYDVATRGIDSLGEWIDREGVTLFHPPVVLFRRYLAMQTGEARHPSVRLVALAGEAVMPADIALWRKRFSPTCGLRHRFSSTEAGHIAVARIEPGELVSNDALPAAFAVADKTLSTVDEHGQPTPDGESGELVVRSAFLAGGYWRRESSGDFRSAPDHPGERIFRTGDLGRINADASFEFLGRRDNQVKIRGYRVELRDVENLLTTLAGVKEAVVFAETREGEAQLIAFVVMSSGHAFDAQALRAEMRRIAPPWKVPVHLQAVDTLPLTLTGKVDRPLLRSQYEPPPASPQLDVGDSTLATVIELFERVLNVADIQPDDHFFDLGGHSLLAAQLLQAIRQRFGRSPAFEVFFQQPTPRRLAESLREELKGNDAPADLSAAIVVPLKTAGQLPPLFCVPAVAGTALTYLPLARLLRSDQPVYALQFPQAMNQSTEVDSIEKTAVFFVEHVRLQSPKGPYRLCGHSYGAVLAYEMARQLHAAGERVDVLAMFDGFVPGSSQQLPLIKRLPMHLARLFERGPREVWRDLLKRRGNSRRDIALAKPQTAALDPTPFRANAAVRAARVKKFRNYRPLPFDGAVTLFRAAIPFEWTRFTRPQPLHGWDAVCKRVEAHTVPGDHLTMLHEPNLSTLAAALNKSLATRDI